jgi:glycosyltransferase involved in cell wall biosynthesis
VIIKVVIQNNDPNKYKVSVVVPTFNVEEYLEECIDSILSQSFDEFEIIIVDNGSTDNTCEIARNYSRSYENVSFYEHPEGGVGGARNFGISKSSSDYLMFVDGDDLLAIDALENLYKKVSENPGIDVVVGNLVKYFKDNIGDFPEFTLIHKREMVINSIKEFHLLIKSQTPTNKLFRKKHLEECGISFPENIVHEDLYFTTITLLNAKKIAIIKDTVYYYRKFEQESITSKDDEVYYFQDRLKILDMIDEYLEKYNLGSDMKEIVDRYKLEKFYVPVERKFYNVYSDEDTLLFLNKVKEQLADVSYELIRDVNRNVPQYLLIKQGLFKQYENLKKYNILDATAENGKLYLESSFENKMIFDITPQIKNIPLIYNIEDIVLVNNAFSLKGYVYLPGLKIEKDNLEVKSVFLMNYDKNEEKHYFNIKLKDRKDVAYNEGAPINCGFEASLDLNKIENWGNKNFKLYLNYYYAGIEKEVQVQIEPYKLFQLAEDYNEILIWRLTNIPKNYFATKREEQKKFMVNNISTASFPKEKSNKQKSSVNKKSKSNKQEQSEKKSSKEKNKKPVELIKSMIEVDGKYCLIDLSSYPSLEGKEIIIKDKDKEQIYSTKVKDGKARLKLRTSLWSLRYINLYYKDGNELKGINSNKVLNIDKIKAKRKIISKFIFNDRTTPFGCYLFYKKIKNI